MKPSIVKVSVAALAREANARVRRNGASFMRYVRGNFPVKSLRGIHSRRLCRCRCGAVGQRQFRAVGRPALRCCRLVQGVDADRGRHDRVRRGRSRLSFRRGIDRHSEEGREHRDGDLRGRRRCGIRRLDSDEAGCGFERLLGLIGDGDEC